MMRRPPGSTLTDTLFPYTTRVRISCRSLFGTGDDLGLGAGPRWRPRVHDCDRGAVDRAARLAAAASPPWRREGDLDARLRLPGGRADRPPHLGAHADLVTVGDAGDRRRNAREDHRRDVVVARPLSGCRGPRDAARRE